MQHITGRDRYQLKMICLDQMVEREAMVRIIDAFVDMLDLKQFGFYYYQLNKEGRPPFHPSTMMKLYLYGYQNSIRSCRRLEKACKTNIEVMWLLREQQPHYKTIAKFRKDNAKAFKEVFRYFVALLKDWELVEGKTIAIDSFKIRAQNSLKNNFNERKVKRHLDYIDKQLVEFEQALEEAEDDEQEQNIAEKISRSEENKEHYKDMGRQLESTSDGQISTTDPDSRAVVFQRNSVRVGYNVQAASDQKYKLLIAADTGDVNDTKALAAMVARVQENTGEKQMDILGDKGYHSGREFKACEALEVTTYVSPKESSSVKANPAYAMESFVYDEQADTYTCPAGELLHTNGRWYNKNLKNGRKSYHVKHYKTKACNGCRLRKDCTSNKLGRIIERTEYAEYVTRNNERVVQNPDYYCQRQQLIEHQFGTLKRLWHFDYTLMRGKQKVMAEVYLAFTCYNLRRSVSILGFDGLMERIKAVFANILNFLLPSRLMVAHKRINKFMTSSTRENIIQTIQYI